FPRGELAVEIIEELVRAHAFLEKGHARRRHTQSLSAASDLGVGLLRCTLGAHRAPLQLHYLRFPLVEIEYRPRGRRWRGRNSSVQRMEAPCLDCIGDLWRARADLSSAVAAGPRAADCVALRSQRKSENGFPFGGQCFYRSDRAELSRGRD